MGNEEIKTGTISRLADGRFEGRMSHTFEGHSEGALWGMLTEPAKIAQWIAPGTIELKVGGAVKIDFEDSGTAIDSKVLELVPGKVLSYSWSKGSDPERPLRWEVSEAGGSATLNLTAIIPANEDPAKVCAGFEGHLVMLAGALEGVPVKFPFQVFLAAREAYKKQI